MTKWSISGRLAALVPLALLAAGCGSAELESPTADKLRGLARLYLDYCVPRNGATPADEAAFKKHIKKLPDYVVATNGVDPAAIDALFVSDRDGEPFVVMYGQPLGTISGNSTRVVAHEKTGAGGKKLVAFVSGKVDLADDARLQEWLAAK